MKKVLLAFAVASIFVACNDSKTDSTTTSDSTNVKMDTSIATPLSDSTKVKIDTSARKMSQDTTKK
jgi:hypothetical protein